MGDVVVISVIYKNLQLGWVGFWILIYNWGKWKRFGLGCSFIGFFLLFWGNRVYFRFFSQVLLFDSIMWGWGGLVVDFQAVGLMDCYFIRGVLV